MQRQRHRRNTAVPIGAGSALLVSIALVTAWPSWSDGADDAVKDKSGQTESGVVEVGIPPADRNLDCTETSSMSAEIMPGARGEPRLDTVVVGYPVDGAATYYLGRPDGSFVDAFVMDERGHTVGVIGVGNPGRGWLVDEADTCVQH